MSDPAVEQVTENLEDFSFGKKKKKTKAKKDDEAMPDTDKTETKKE